MSNSSLACATFSETLSPREIKDGQLKHALRIFCDEDSGGVRIEVTARRGPMAKVPIWTSFILNSIKSRYWVQKSSSRAVRFTELQPYVFCDNYLPTKDARGRFEILFTSRAGEHSPLMHFA